MIQIGRVLTVVSLQQSFLTIAFLTLRLITLHGRNENWSVRVAIFPVTIIILCTLMCGTHHLRYRTFEYVTYATLLEKHHIFLLNSSGVFGWCLVGYIKTISTRSKSMIGQGNIHI